ncbi:MAG: DUF952 domain-containing protein [Acidimicrobiales bacterium]
MTLLHICGSNDWPPAGPHYRTPTFDGDGFIHLSRADQVDRPANRLYQGRHDLVLLVIDETELSNEVRWEPSAVPEEDGELFPHLYGDLSVAAVTEVVPFPPGADGIFSLPRTLEWLVR